VRLICAKLLKRVFEIESTARTAAVR